MDNDQPTTLGEGPKSTETGAYLLNGDMTSGTETAVAGALWRLPTENEWYKAAYYDPNLNSAAGGYWKFATQSNTQPDNVMGTGSNEANYCKGGVYCATGTTGIVASQDYLTPVGTFKNSVSFYGTFDQNGDVFQWNDSSNGSLYRGLRGGNWHDNWTFMQSTDSLFEPPTEEDDVLGFRLVESSIPEPTSVILTLGGMASLALVRRKPSRS
jgi:formylglycine-generating enzyme required for sulfatase activity